MSNKILILISMGIACMWAPVNLSIKIAMEDMTPSAIAFLRWSIMAVLLWSALSRKWFREKLDVKFPSNTDALMMVSVGIFILGPAHAIFYNSLLITTSIESSVLNTTAPIWTGLLAVLILKEKVSLNRWLAILLSGIGAYIVAIGFHSPLDQMNGGNVYGNMMYLAGVILECLCFVLTSKIVSRSSGLGAAAWQYLGMAISAVILHALLPNLFENIKPIEIWAFSWKTALAITHMAGIAGVFCFSVWYILMGRLPLSLLVLCVAIEPIVAIIAGAVFLNEPIDIKEIVGTVLIITSLFVATRDEKDSNDSNDHPSDSGTPAKALIEA